MWENEPEDEDLEAGTGIEPELLDGQCLSLLQLKEAVEETIKRVESEGGDPSAVPVLVMGKQEDGDGEFFHMVDIMLQSKEDGSELEALLLTDVSGEDPDISQL